MTSRGSTARLGRGLLVGLACVLLVTSAVGPGLAADGTTGQLAQSGTDSTVDETADAAYVTDDGDVVLVYEDSRPGDANTTGQFSANVEENLVYGQITEPVAETPNVTGDITAQANASQFTADGALSFPRPESVEQFNLSMTGETTAEDSRSDIGLSARFTNVSGPFALLDTARTEGTVRTGPDRLQANGSFNVETALPVSQDSRLAMTVEETDDAYELSVERREALQGDSVSAWSNRSRALETIRDQYAGNESTGNGTVDVALDRYDLTEREDGSTVLDARFTVTYADVDEQLTESLARAFTLTGSAQSVSTTGVSAGETTTPIEPNEDARELAEELLATDVREAGFEYESSSGTYSGSFALDVRGYQDFALAYYEYAESMGAGGPMAASLDRARAQYEAQAAADLTQRLSWNGTLTSASDEMALDLSVTSRTDNWADYVSELESRDVPVQDSEYELTGTTDGDRIELDGSMSVSGERLFETWAEAIEQTAAGMGSSTAEGPRTGQAVPATGGPDANVSATMDSLARSEPQRAKFSGSYDEDGLRLEFGAEFGNLSALRDDIATAAGASGLNVTEVVSETDGDTERTYVRVSNVAGDGDSTDEVQALPTVTSDTTVQSTAEHDGEIPTMDVEAASSFLTAGSSGVLGPGFGPIVALVALLAAVLGGSMLARRRS